MTSLSQLLAIYHDKKVWVLIDEYDTVFNDAYLHLNDKEIINVTCLFGNIFTSLFKGNAHLKKGIVTGVQYLGNSGILSEVHLGK